MRILTAFVLSAALATSATAQRGGFGGGHVGGGGHAAGGEHAPAVRSPLPSFAQPRGGFAFGRSGYGNRFSRYGPYGSLLWPLFGDYDLDDLYAGGYPISAELPMAYLQAAREMAGLQSARGNVAPESAPAEPLMIELQGENYVRVNSTPANGEAQAIAGENILSRDTSYSSSTTHTTNTAPLHVQELPPAVLIFRDGHSEQVRGYTIADGVLYAHGDLYIDGYWNKQIDLASLDLPQTVQANANRNVQFALPSSPNEVIARF